MRKKILILGGSGFIGRNLCNYLVSKDYGVLCMDQTPVKIQCEGIKHIQGDFFGESI